MLQADLLESISETRYLSADNYTVYRTILRIFYLEHQKMHYQMDRDAVLVLLREQSRFAQYTPEQLMFELMGILDFDYIINSQALWGCYACVTDLDIAEMHHPPNAPVVTILRYHWNGKQRALEDSL